MADIADARGDADANTVHFTNEQLTYGAVVPFGAHRFRMFRYDFDVV